MISVDLVFDLCGYWHAGTGRGAGTDVDAVVFRSPAGLPMLPGRTVRGLLRDALELAVEIGAVPTDPWPGRDPVTWCFGTGIESGGDNDDRVEAMEEIRFRTLPGHLRFESALIGDDRDSSRAWEAWAAANRARVEHLFAPFAATKLDADGVAQSKTLRAIEVAVPLTLRAPVEGPQGPPWADALREAATLIRGIGSHRHRGLGRVSVRLEDAA